jgi:hypothetical protein
MHAIGMGGLTGMMMVIAFSGQAFSFWPLPLAILITGLVCTARLIVTDHTKEDLFMGLLIGIGTQLLAWWI